MPAMPRREVQGASPAIKSVLPGLLSLREGGKGQAGGTTGEAQMKVLIACEYSGRTRQAFRDLGHDAWSCDLLESEDNSPHHIQGDVLPILQEPWDLVIAHPPCTYLAVSGMHWTARGLRDPQLTEDALDFVRALMAAQSPRIAIENPISVISSRIRKPDQIIQPWWFGDDASKKNVPMAERASPARAKHQPSCAAERMGAGHGGGGYAGVRKLRGAVLP